MLLSSTYAKESIPIIVGRINDFAEMLISYEEIQLEKLLEDNEKASNNQIVVVTIDKLMGDALEDYSMRLAEKWKIGKKGKDNGVILLIAGRGKEVRIEVGSGLEGALPDRLCRSIIQKEITPFFNGGYYFLGIKNGLNAIIKETKNFYTLQKTEKDISETSTLNSLVVILSILAGFLVLWVGKGILKLYDIFIISRGKSNEDKSKFKLFPNCIGYNKTDKKMEKLPNTSS